MHFVEKALAVLVVSLLAACSAPDAKRGRLLGADAERASEEANRINKMMAVRVIRTDAEGEGTIEEWTPGEFGEALDDYCGPKVSATCEQFGDSCGASKCILMIFACQAEITLAIAKDEASNIEFVRETGPNQERFKILPQNTATKAALSAQAIEGFYSVSRTFLQMLDPADTVCWNNRALYAGQLARSVVEMFYLMKEAQEVLTSSVLAVSDAERSSTPSRTLAGARAEAQDRLSRSAVAHYLLGGEPGLRGSQTAGFCDVGPLSGPAQAALKVFRESGVSPVAVLDTANTSIDELLNGVGTDVPTGSVRQRLFSRWGVTQPTGPGDPKLETYYRLKVQDFEDARKYMIQEIRAFSRSLTATLLVTPTPDYPVFAATASPAPDRDPSYYVALASTDCGDSYCPCNEPSCSTTLLGANGTPAGSPLALGGTREGFRWRPVGSSFPTSVPGFGDDIAAKTDVLLSLVDQLLRKAEVQQEPTYIQVFGTLHRLSERASERRARLVHCTGGGQPDTFKLNGVSTSETAIMARGEDALECLTKGSTEGALCGANFIPTNWLIGTFDGTGTPDAGFQTAAALFLPAGLPAAPERWYVLVPRAGATSFQWGQFEALTGFVPYGHSGTSAIQRMCRDIPIFQAFNEQVKKALAPNREQCSGSQEHCSGVDFDERIPLEDELGSDEDDVESSWRRYLDLAEQAAKESDLLGQEYVRAALETERDQLDVELRQQGQQEKAANRLLELQEICGTSVDPGPLVAQIAKIAAEKKGVNAFTKDLGSFSVSDFDLAPCPAQDDNDSRTKCFAGRNAIDVEHLINTVDELGNLRQCMKKLSDTGGRIHLGTVPVCVWPGSDGNLCSGKPPGQMCPDVAGKGGACPSGATRVADGLGFFDTHAALPAAPSATMCGAIRALQADPNNAEGRQKFNELIGSNVFNKDVLQSPYITFEARYLTHGAILVGEDPASAANSVRWSTGSPESGPQTGSWPCNAADIAGNCPAGGSTTCPNGGGGNGLFCTVCDCSDEAQRGAIVRRMIRAVAAAQLTRVQNGGPVPMMKLPVYVTPDVVAPGGVIPFLAGDAGKTVRNGGTQAAPIREHQLMVRRGGGGSTRMDGVAFSAPSLAQGAFGRNAFVLPESSPMDVSPPGKNFAIVNGAIGPRRPFPPRNAEVPYDPISKFYGGMATDGSGEGYFAKILLLAGTDPTATGVPSGYSVPLPTSVSVDFVSASGPDNIGLPFEPLLTSYPFTRSSLLDGLELLCEVKSAENSFNSADCGQNLPVVTGFGDLPNVTRYLNCLGRKIQRRGALTVFGNFPPEAKDPLRKDSPVGTHAAVSGTLGKHYSDLRGALWDIAEAGPGVGREISGLARDMDDLRITAAINENNKSLANVQFWSTVAQAIAQCADAGTNLIEIGASFGAHAAIQCASAVAQVGFASEINRLSQANANLATKLAQNNFQERFANRVSALQTLSSRLGKATEIVDGVLIDIQNTRRRGRRALEEALWLLSQEAKSQAAVSNVLVKGKATAEARYLSAFQNAKLTAFLAKRAVEQRLGIKLAEMTDALPLVAAPASWEGTICARSGIDYEALASKALVASPFAASGSFADAFIGDYVQNLQNLVESYRLEYNFHEGVDTAVVSLRDDIHNVRAPCATESKNLLYFSTDLKRTGRVFDAENPAWFLDGCRTTTIQGETFPLSDCIGVTKAAQNGVDVRPFITAALELRSVPGHTLNFGDGASCGPATCGWQTGAALVQQVTLPQGLYRFSWYTPDSCTPLPSCLTTTTAPGILTGFAKTVAGTELRPASTDTVNNGLVPGNATTWNRPYFLFELTEPTEIKVGFRATAAPPVDAIVAAPMLEAVEHSNESVTREPRAFSATTETRMVTLPICEDTNGAVFRPTQWHRECIKLCSDGFASECAGEQAQTACYRETAFNISQSGIESGSQFVQAGFARGNFNYRIESIGLNFVGTGIRSCEDQPLASTCHSGGYVTYTLEHQGPYFVRNHFGEDYEAKLFPGSIEHARGLGNERYLTNPLSSTDSELIASYLRTELRGRPLDGNFILRVWEEPGFRFDAVQDVQILVKYRYWTRFQ
jgi:hypothetical protein